jgi:hypothetical protein
MASQNPTWHVGLVQSRYHSEQYMSKSVSPALWPKLVDEVDIACDTDFVMYYPLFIVF